jgi:hypothetical protein
MASAAQPRAALGTRKSNTPGVLARAQAMFDHMSADPANFADPTVDLATFLSLIEGLQSAQYALQGTRSRGAGEARDSKRQALWTAMGSLLSYVQALADKRSPTDAEALIRGAGLVLAKVVVPHKPVLQAKLTPVQGVVALIANLLALVGPGSTSKKVVFRWQVSTDGQTWKDLDPTPWSKTTVAGLALMTTYSFRVSVTVGQTPGEWSQPVSLLVH